MTKIKPCYRDYKAEISTLFIAFRREDKTPAEVKFWASYFPNTPVGETVGFVVPDDFLSGAKEDFPNFDFETEEVTE